MDQVTIQKTEKYIIVKIPVKSIKRGKASISSHSLSVVNKAIIQGVSDIESGRIFGPFKNIKNFKIALKNR